MSRETTTLAKATMAQLIEELARRKNEQPDEAEIAEWCEDCAHYRWAKNDAEAVSPRFNGCGKGHRMQFQMPNEAEGPHPHSPWGYYRLCCPDRKPKPEPAPPPPAPPPPRNPQWSGRPSRGEKAGSER